MTERLTQERLEAIRKRAEAATEGPWRDNFGSFVDGIEVWSDGGCILSTEGGIVRYSDAEFTAEARTDIPALLELIDELYAENSRLCPIGDLDTITTLQTEIEYRDEIIAARDAEVARLRTALEFYADYDNNEYELNNAPWYTELTESAVMSDGGWRAKKALGGCGMIKRLICKHRWKTIHRNLFAFKDEYGCAKCGRTRKVWSYNYGMWRFKREMKGDTFE